MLAKISSFLFSIVEAAEHKYDSTNKGYGSRHVWGCLKIKNSMVQVVSECPNHRSSTSQSHSLCYLLIEIFFNQSQRRRIHHDCEQKLLFKTLVTYLLVSYSIRLDAAVAPELSEL